MAGLKQLASQTAIYGLSSIVGRFLNYLLVPLYVYTFPPAQYGIVTEFYAYVVVLQILLTYGMETGYFRFSSKLNESDTVFSTVITSVFTTSSLFLIIILFLNKSISAFLGYSNHPEYVLIFTFILIFDSLTAIFFAKLRSENKALKFATYKIINISINIVLNLLFILILPKFKDNNFITRFYNPDFGIGYIFVANFVASLVTLLLFFKDFFKIKYYFNFALLKQILKYSLPLLLTGLTGVINEMADRILIKYLTPIPSNVTDAHHYVLYQLGIYGANAKLAILMMLFVQAFKYAAEPFFFSNSKTLNKESLKLFSKVMNYFIGIAFFAFLFILLNLHLVRYFISKDYFAGLNVVLPLFLFRIFVGIFFILSFWYKLTDKTHYSVIIFTIGASITLTLDFIFIPKYGYIAAAWSNFISYFVMVIISYIWSRKYLHVNFNFKKIFFYSIFALIIYLSTKFINFDSTFIKLIINNLLILIYVFAFIKIEKIKLKDIKNVIKFRKVKSKNN